MDRHISQYTENSMASQLLPEDAPSAKTKYEMSLAEFPVAFLSTRIPEATKSIIYEDEITGKDGRPVKRRWEIFPHASLGFPTPSTQATLFELFQLWAEQDFSSPDIHFGTLYELIKRKGIKQATSVAYTRIREDLDRLVGITIRAKNAFWDNEAKAYVTKTFHLFESVDLYHADPNNALQTALPFSKITASSALWQSIGANAIIALRDVDRELYHSLTPTEQRLGVYLAKMLNTATTHRRNLDKLASQLPIIASRQKDIKKMVVRACDGLIKKNFPYLSSYYFQKTNADGGENIVFKRRHIKGTPRIQDIGSLTMQQIDLLNQINEFIADPADQKRSNGFYTTVVRKVPPNTIYRALSTTRQASSLGDIKTTRARYFTTVIKKLATEQDITL
jgi:hypothetical protein